MKTRIVAMALMAGLGASAAMAQAARPAAKKAAAVTHVILMRHFAAAKGEVIVQIYGPGPFVVNYINPSDDPTKRTP